MLHSHILERKLGLITFYLYENPPTKIAFPSILLYGLSHLTRLLIILLSQKYSKENGEHTYMQSKKINNNFNKLTAKNRQRSFK